MQKKKYHTIEVASWRIVTERNAPHEKYEYIRVGQPLRFSVLGAPWNDLWILSYMKCSCTVFFKWVCDCFYRWCWIPVENNVTHAPKYFYVTTLQRNVCLHCCFIHWWWCSPAKPLWRVINAITCILLRFILLLRPGMDSLFVVMQRETMGNNDYKSYFQPSN